jgi:gluconokinase
MRRAEPRSARPSNSPDKGEEDDSGLPSRIVVMGVSGCGKSTVARALAARLGRKFVEGDDFHPSSNVEAMRQGIPLSDEMRSPWLDAIAEKLADAGLEGEGGVVASCSALKRKYRDRLRRSGDVFFVHLAVDRDTARARLASRKGHFMHAELVDSQFAALQPLGSAEWGAALDATKPVAFLVEDVMNVLGRGASSSVL